MPEFHSAAQQFLSAALRRRRGNAVGAIVPKNEDLRFSFCENELGTDPTLPVMAEEGVGGKRQAHAAPLEYRPVSLYLSVMGLSSIVEGRTAGDRNARSPPDTADTATNMMAPT